jgi:cyclic pyranopterin phosphate synthase
MSDATEELSHVNGAARMVDTGAKQAAPRRTVAVGAVVTRPEVIELLTAGRPPAGEALTVARVAGIMAAKQTSQLVPLRHPLPITGVDVGLEASGDRVEIRAEVRAVAVTGVETEALTAVSVAAVTVYDMIKAVDAAADSSGQRRAA